ncbi:hypothetical protein JI735_33835 (plasmid) [Paenibacillus sonchi]|uniref:Uncharacterized protein n=1 Tax=Paenibacillus sonchi TaxID=373687 RepID=A0A974SFH9_9BACL|nr:hypothetical protein [Paenibacillus sonchi]QQZ64633.1 hypothetical protein JI735_33835 [Paenibacillus sonchi]
MAAGSSGDRSHSYPFQQLPAAAAALRGIDQIKRQQHRKLLYYLKTMEICISVNVNMKSPNESIAMSMMATANCNMQTAVLLFVSLRKRMFSPNTILESKALSKRAILTKNLFLKSNAVEVTDSEYQITLRRSYQRK